MDFEKLQRMAARVRGEERPGMYDQAHRAYRKKQKGIHFCNVRACQAPLETRWWNLSTRAFYCQRCATKINRGSTAEDQKTCIELYGIPELLVIEGSPEYKRLGPPA